LHRAQKHPANTVIHLRVVSPPERTDAVVELLAGDDATCNIVRLDHASTRPDGDVVMADVAREDASVIVSDLRHMGVVEDGSVTLTRIDTALGPHARRAIARAEGDEADAVVWEEVQSRTSEEASLSWTYLTFMLLAACIGVSGLLTNNPILIVGAMVVSPDFGPLAGVCVGLTTNRRGLAARSFVAIIAGFAAAALAAWLLSELLFATGAADAGFRPDLGGLANLIASPDAYTFIVAFCAGAAGTLSLTTAKSGALIGVLISVTTIPAASDIGLSAASSDWDSMLGSAAQLGANIATIIVAGSLTLIVQRIAFVRRRRAHLAARQAAGRP
jgi:uncharacterized hydrophobic protein (TIGR00271 family)